MLTRSRQLLQRKEREIRKRREILKKPHRDILNNRAFCAYLRYCDSVSKKNEGFDYAYHDAAGHNDDLIYEEWRITEGREQLSVWRKEYQEKIREIDAETEESIRKLLEEYQLQSIP